MSDDPLHERFDAKWEPEPMTGCWLWTACTNRDGYGVMREGSQVELSHRLSWKLHRGSIPDGMYVLHHCDTASCVNPAHLFLGTQSDNIIDMVKKGRGNPRRGEAHHLTTLTNRDVRNIRATADTPHQSLADQYGVTPSVIGDVLRRRTWGHV